MASTTFMPDQTMMTPSFFIYRDYTAVDATDPRAAVPLAFFPDKDSDELHDALRARYPHLRTHTERMRDAMLDFLMEESTSPEDLSAITSPWQHSISNSPSETTSPSFDSDMARTASNESTHMAPMTTVFSLKSSQPPKQRTRRKMTETEKAEYRKRRQMKACEKCAKRKRKCTHNQDAEVQTQKVTKSTTASVTAKVKQQALVADHILSGIGNVQEFDDFTLVLDEPLPELDFSMNQDVDFAWFGDFTSFDQNFIDPRHLQQSPTYASSSSVSSSPSLGSMDGGQHDYYADTPLRLQHDLVQTRSHELPTPVLQGLYTPRHIINNRHTDTGLVADHNDALINGTGVNGTGVNARRISATEVTATGIRNIDIIGTGERATGINSASINATGVIAAGITSDSMNATGVIATDITSNSMNATGATGTGITSNSMNATGAISASVNATSQSMHLLEGRQERLPRAVYARALQELGYAKATSSNDAGLHDIDNLVSQKQDLNVQVSRKRPALTKLVTTAARYKSMVMHDALTIPQTVSAPYAAPVDTSTGLASQLTRGFKSLTTSAVPKKHGEKASMTPYGSSTQSGELIARERLRKFIASQIFDTTFDRDFRQLQEATILEDCRSAGADQASTARQVRPVSPASTGSLDNSVGTSAAEKRDACSNDDLFLQQNTQEVERTRRLDHFWVRDHHGRTAPAGRISFAPLDESLSRFQNSQNSGYYGKALSAFALVFGLLALVAASSASTWLASGVGFCIIATSYSDSPVLKDHHSAATQTRRLLASKAGRILQASTSMVCC